jgi:peptidoglycan/xylan/chitin deacetylase (PgdA/CDA1 family)
LVIHKSVAIGALLLSATLFPPGRPAFAAAERIYSAKATCRDIALTYDTEFSPTTQSLVDMLDELKVKTTWFFVGQSVAHYPNLVRQVAAHHEIGNHTFDHPDMPKLSRDGMRGEIQRAEAAIASTAGVSPRPLFRPPYGAWNSTLLEVAADTGYSHVVLWTIDTQDWTGVSAEAIRQQITRGAFPGAIVVMHGAPANTVAGTRLAVGDLRARGYQFVSVSELMGNGRDQRDFGGESYSVQPGDSWQHIGACHNVAGSRLQAYNDLADAQAPSPGTVLQIPHADEVTILRDGERLTFPVYPRLTPDGWILADIGLAEQLGARLEQAGERTRLLAPGLQIKFTPGDQIARVNGTPVAMGIAPVLVDGHLLVSAEFLATQLHADIGWESATRLLRLTSPAPPAAPLPLGTPRPGGSHRLLPV